MIKFQLMMLQFIWFSQQFPFQSLEIHHLSETDSLFEFTMQNKQYLDLEDIVSETSLFPRSFLENLHAKAGVQQVYISVTSGRLNSHLYGNKIDAPTHGSMVISNSDVQQELMIYQLSEIFRITTTNIQNNPAHFMNIESQNLVYAPIGFQEGIQFKSQSLLYAQDPTDVICVDGIQNIKQYMGCEGKKGLFSVIDQNTIFQSSYLSVQGYFEYDPIQLIASQKIVILALMPKQEIGNIFVVKGWPIKSCHQFSKASFSHSMRNNGVFNLQKAQSLAVRMLQKQPHDISYNFTQTRKIMMKNYISGEWFAFQSHYNQWVQVLDDGRLEFQVYFQNDFIPIFSSMQLYAEGQHGERLNVTFIKTLEFNEEYKMITIQVDLKSQTYVFFSIKFDKKLKAFEEYPHDPDRGHDIISFPIKFTSNNQTQLHFTENQVTRIPAPDFSMPFNILTYTCLTLGYYFLQTFRLSVDRFEFDKKEKGSLLQRVVGLVWNLIRKQD